MAYFIYTETDVGTFFPLFCLAGKVVQIVNTLVTAHYPVQSQDLIKNIFIIIRFYDEVSTTSQHLTD